ncbi:MAG: spheroidene monooxygenase [Pseudomonadota bacterium]
MPPPMPHDDGLEADIAERRPFSTDDDPRDGAVPAAEPGPPALAPQPAPVAASAPRSRLSYTRPAALTGHHAGSQVVTLTCYRFERPLARLRQIGSMALGPRALARLPGCGFARMMGTGTGEGFDPAPNTAVWTVLAAWEDRDAAARGLAARPFAARAARAEEHCTITMAPLTTTGRWGGVEPFECSETSGSPSLGDRPLAVLTRATVKPRHAWAFWSRVPAINRQIAAGPGMLFRLGMGEVPLLHQVTFSVWQSAEAMRAFAYRGEGHRTAIAAVRSGDWFSEELFARFAVLNTEGRWQGKPLLA